MQENMKNAIHQDSRIVVLVDAARWNRTSHADERAAAGQIEGSDAVLVNKTDPSTATHSRRSNAISSRWSQTPFVLNISALGDVPDDVWKK
jgi:G3E family GTPase